MRMALVVALVVGALAVAAFVVRGFVRRFRLARRLERTEVGVAEAIADGRLAAATGEAVLQHLEGLRRACVWRGEG